MKIKDIQPNASVDVLEAEVISVEEPREFTNFRGSGRVTNAVLKDDSGEVKMTLWNEQVDEVKEGAKIKLENGWAKEYRNELQVSSGKFGKLTIEGAEKGAAEEEATPEEESPPEEAPEE